MRSILLVLGGCLLAGCATTFGEDGASVQDEIAATVIHDGDVVTGAQLAALAPPGMPAIVFPSSGDPEIHNGQLVSGKPVAILYALNRLPQCRTTHDGFAFWDTRIGGQFSNGTKIGEERSATEGSVRGFDGPSFAGTARAVPLVISVPIGAESFYLYAHNTSPAGAAAACDAYDSKSSANYQFQVEPSTAGISDGARPSASGLATTLVDIGDGSDTAAIVFGTDGEPVFEGNLVQGGRVIVAYSLDRLPQCRAMHDGWPFWTTQIGGVFSDGTKVGDTGATSFYDGDQMPGHVVRFVSTSGPSHSAAMTVPTVFQVPADATDFAVWAHNWNPGGPVSPCSAYDSRNGSNYHFPVRRR